MEKITFVCPCLFGLESVLKFEITRIGGENIVVNDGKITFEGDFTTLARANICLASAERVLIRLGEFRAHTFEELFQGVKALPLENYIGRDDRFPVKGHSLDSALHSIPDCQAIIKKAAVERLKTKYGIAIFPETGCTYQLQFSIMKDIASIYLDTSGISLHKRGYRRNANAAPIRETLAAGIVDLAFVKGSSTVVDPFCGSGTLLIEAAYKALNIAPGIRRTFAAEEWDVIDKKIWADERTRAMDSIVKDNEFMAYGYDIDPEAVALTQENCRKAGVQKRITVKQADVRDYENLPNTITICNPPYGERMLELKQAEELYSVMGKRFLGTRESPCFVIAPNEDFEQYFGRRADKRRKLYNGMIKCQLYMYFKK